MVLMVLLAGQRWRCRHRGQTCGRGRGRKETGVNGESSAEAYALTGVRQRAWGLRVTESLGTACDGRELPAALCGNPGAGGGGEGGTCVY